MSEHEDATPTLKLFVVNVSCDFYQVVAAIDENEAEHIAKESSEENGDIGDNLECSASEFKALPDGWDENCNPFVSQKNYHLPEAFWSLKEWKEFVIDKQLADAKAEAARVAFLKNNPVFDGFIDLASQDVPHT